MLRSMTAYGRSTTDTDIGLFVVEIQSVNKKHLEVQLQMPRLLGCFEADVRKWITTAVKRGQVTVRVTPSFNENAPIKVLPNLALAKQLHSAWNTIRDSLGIKGEVTLDMLQGEQGILLFDENPNDLAGLKGEMERAVNEALIHFMGMKEREGRALANELLERAGVVIDHLEEIVSLGGGAVDKMRERLIQTIKDAAPGALDNDDRILREVAILADKLDIAEEVSRLRSHVDQFTGVVEGSGLRAGKTMEFLLQEMNREINTIGSKASDLEITKRVIAIKGELERMREQVHNVE